MTRKRNGLNRPQGFGAALAVKGQGRGPHGVDEGSPESGGEVIEAQSTPLAVGSMDAFKLGLIKSKTPGNVDVPGSLGGFDSVNNSVPPDAVDPAPPAGGETPVPVADKKPLAAGDQLTIKADELEGLIHQRGMSLAQSLNRQMIEQADAAQKELDRVTARAEEERKRQALEVEALANEAARLRKLVTVSGSTGGDGMSTGDPADRFAVNYLRFPITREPRGAAKEVSDMLNCTQHTPVVERFTDEGPVRHRNFAALDSWLRDPANMAAAKRDFELLAKGYGLLTGGDAVSRDNAGQTRNAPSSIPDYFMDFLSSTIRLTHTPRYIFHQFATRGIDIGQMPGQTVRVPRFENLPMEDDIEGYLLDDGTTGINISPAAQSLRQTSVPIEVATYGLGRGTSIATRKLSVSAMVRAANIDGLLETARRVLGLSFYGFEEIGIRRCFELARGDANNIFYNDAGRLTNNPASILPGDDGTVTTTILSQIAAEMSMADIPTYDNGRRIALLNPKAVATLRESAGDKLQAGNQAELEAVLNVFYASDSGGTGRVSGYIGEVEGFSIFESSTIAKGAANTNGVYNVVTGAGNVLMRDNYFFGPGVVGYAVASEMEIVQEVAPFRTALDYIWQTTCGFAPMDCSAHLGSGSQTRVRILRAAETPI